MPWDITTMKNMILCLAVAVLLSGCAGVIEK
ncbi:TPA: cor protein, partial [Enterobacter hormaechei]|nr:cor protein [Enterobacter hormaechei]HAS1544203.1 cor protein [Enterobacter hormaechei]